MIKYGGRHIIYLRQFIIWHRIKYISYPVPFGFRTLIVKESIELLYTLTEEKFTNEMLVNS